MIDALVRPNIRNLQPYSSARSLYQSGTFFDANENALGSTVTLPRHPELNRYPDPYSRTLRAGLATFTGTSEENIFVGNGSDEAIDLLIRIFVNPGEAIVTLDPTYGMYRVAADTAGVEVRSASLNSEFQIDFPTLWKTAAPNAKIIFCCSPNNPTGNTLQRKDIETLCTTFQGIVVVDEAYIEYASTPSIAALVNKYENLVVLRTFSKAWGLAGLRVGYAVASASVISYFNKVKAPYNLNRVSAALAVKALAKRKTMETMVRKTLRERERVADRLRSLSFHIFPSEANFLLVKYPVISNLCRTLAVDYGLIIRDFGSKKGIEDCARISIATPKQNDRLLKTIEKIL